MNIVYESVEIVKYLESAQSFSNTTATTITDGTTDWTQDVKAGEHWLFQCALFLSLTNTSNDMGFQFDGPASTGGKIGSVTAETAQSAVHDWSSYSGALGLTTGGDTILINGTAIVTADGTLDFRARLNSGSGTNLTFAVGSFLKLHRVK